MLFILKHLWKKYVYGTIETYCICYWPSVFKVNTDLMQHHSCGKHQSCSHILLLSIESGLIISEAGALFLNVPSTIAKNCPLASIISFLHTWCFSLKTWVMYPERDGEAAVAVGLRHSYYEVWFQHSCLFSHLQKLTLNWQRRWIQTNLMVLLYASSSVWSCYSSKVKWKGELVFT